MHPREEQSGKAGATLPGAGHTVLALIYKGHRGFHPHHVEFVPEPLRVSVRAYERHRSARPGSDGRQTLACSES